MAKLDLALVVRTVDQATRPLRRIQQSVQRLGQQTGLDRIGRQTLQVGRQMGRVGREAGRLAKRVGLVSLAIGAGAVAFGQKYANAADRVAKTADRIGVGVEELQELRHAFDIGGASIEATDKGLQFFARSIGEAHKGTGEANEIFEAMGITLKKEDGTLKTTRELLDEVADAMQNQEDPAKKAFAAQRLFGRAGMALINTLDDGSESIQKIGSEVQAYGVITDEEARRAEEYIDAQARFKGAITGVGNAIGAFLIPELLPAIEHTRKWITENKAEIVERFGSAIKALASFIKDSVTQVKELVESGKQFRGWIKDTFPFVEKLLGYLFDMASEFGWVKVAAIILATFLGGKFIVAVLGLIGPLFSLASTIAMVAVKLGILALANPVIAGIVLAIGTIALAAVRIYQEWDGIVQYFKDIWQGIKDAFDFKWLDWASGIVKNVLGVGDAPSPVN